MQINQKLLILVPVLAGLLLTGCSLGKNSSQSISLGDNLTAPDTQVSQDGGDDLPAPLGEDTSIGTAELSELLQGGSSYAAPDGSYSFLYPNEYQIEPDRPEGVRVFKIGPSSRPQSEIADGVSILFTQLELPEGDLEAAVDTAIADLQSAGIAEMTQPKKPVRVGPNAGYTYTARGLGEFTHLYLQSKTNPTVGLVVVYMVSDPNGKNYQSEVDAILESVDIN